MPTKKIEILQKVYQVKVTLPGTSPPIWRRLLVPGRFGEPEPNDRLMGLPALGLRYGKLKRRVDVATGNERTTRLFSVLGRVGAKAVYTYDFGDSWEHAITVEKVLPPEPGRAYPVCTDGKRHGPPEDCGGIPGFYNLLEAVADPAHDQHEELRDWLGGGFDPEVFSVEEVNRRLAPLQRGRASR